MNLTISLTSIKKATVTFLHRFHIMIFVIVVLVGLIFIVYLLYNIIISSTDTNGATPTATNTSFDEATIKRINDLKTREQSGDDLDLSQGRTNPFVE
jgi:exopolysaccharide biosynthesis protein